MKFLSLEPLLGPFPDLDLDGIDWVIVGGESGPKAGAMSAEWVVDIKNQCIAAGVPFFFKQWGGTNKKKAGRLLERRTWDEMPTFEASPFRKQSKAATGSYSIECVSQTLRIHTSRNRKSLCSLAKVSH